MTSTNELLIRRVHVNRTRSLQEALDATGRDQYVSKWAAKSMPKGDGEKVDVIFFKLGRIIKSREFEQGYTVRGLIPADPYSLAQVNANEPTFADNHPNATC